MPVCPSPACAFLAAALYALIYRCFADNPFSSLFAVTAFGWDTSAWCYLCPAASLSCAGTVSASGPWELGLRGLDANDAVRERLPQPVPACHSPRCCRGRGWRLALVVAGTLLHGAGATQCPWLLAQGRTPVPGGGYDPLAGSEVSQGGKHPSGRCRPHTGAGATRTAAPKPPGFALPRSRNPVEARPERGGCGAVPPP